MWNSKNLESWVVLCLWKKIIWSAGEQISQKKIKSAIIEENNENIAVLEINPISKGHTIIIPKKHLQLDEIEQESVEFAEKISKQIKQKLSPKEIKISKKEIKSWKNLQNSSNNWRNYRKRG